MPSTPLRVFSIITCVKFGFQWFTLPFATMQLTIVSISATASSSKDSMFFSYYP